MKLTESKLRQIIREELVREIGGVDSHAVYEIEPSHLRRVKSGDDVSKFGIKMKEGEPAVLQNWAERQGWTFRPERELEQDGYYVERSRGQEKYYVIAKNR